MLTELYDSFLSLRDQSGYEISQQISQIHSNIESFPALLEIIQTSANQAHQKMAVIGLGMCMKANKEHIQQDGEMIGAILELCYSPISDFVRRNAIFYFESCIFADELAENVFEFVRGREISQQFEFETSVHLLIVASCLLNSTNAEIVSYAQELNQHAIESGVTDYTLLLSARISQSGEEDFCVDFPQLLSQGFESLIGYIGINDLVKCGNATKFLVEFIGGEAENYIEKFACSDAEPLLTVLIPLFEKAAEIIQNAEIDENIRAFVVNVCDSIIPFTGDLVSLETPFPEKFQELINSYVLYTAQTCTIEDEECDLSSDNVFWAIRSLTQTSNEIFDMVFNETSHAEESAEMLYAVISLLTVTFDEYNYFYDAEHFGAVEQLLSSAIQSEVAYIRSACASSVSSYTAAFKHNPLISLGELVTVFLQVMVEAPTQQFLGAFESIVECLPSTDNIFDISFEALNTIIQAEGYESLRSSAINCISSLSKHSDESIIYHIDEIMTLIGSVLSSGDEDSIPNAIYCISKLCTASPERVLPFLSSVIDSIVSCIDPESCACFEAIHTFGAVLSIIDTAQIAEISSQVLGKLLEIMIADIEKIKSQEMEDPMFDEGDGEEGEDEDCFFSELPTVVAASIRVSCQILSLYPDSLIEHFEQISAILDEEISSFSSSITYSCAIGIEFITRGLAAIGVNESTAELIMRTTSLAIKLCNSGGCGDLDTARSSLSSLQSCVALAQHVSLESIQEDISEIISISITGGFMLRPEQGQSMDPFYSAAYGLLSFCIQNEELRPIILSKIESIACDLEDESKSRFIYSFVENNFSILPEPIIVAVFEAGMKALETEDYGSALLCIVTLSIATTKTDVYEQLITFCITKLTESSEQPPSSSLEHQINACIISLSLFQKALGAEFPIASLPFEPLFAWMPPSFELESSQRVMEFFAFLSTIPDLQSFLAVPLIKLFSDSSLRMSKRNLSEETRVQLLGLLKSVVPADSNCSELVKEVFGEENERKAQFLSESLTQ